MDPRHLVILLMSNKEAQNHHYSNTKKNKQNGFGDDAPNSGTIA